MTQLALFDDLPRVESDKRFVYHDGTEATDEMLEHDTFVTPLAVIDAFLSRFTADFPQFAPASIGDIGANDGRWGAAAKRCYPQAHLTGFEIRQTAPLPRFDDWIVGDFLSLRPERFWDEMTG
jgi:hypothetical protein